jgi:hypothetical protein
MARRTLTGRQARHLLAAEASLAELHGRRFELAIGRGDLDGARRWYHEYRLATSRCATLGALVRTRGAARAHAA